MTQGELTYRRVLRLPHVTQLVASTFLSRFGAEMLTLALILYVLQRFHSPALAGLVAFASLAPGMLASPVAGAVLDRFGSARGIGIDMVASSLLIFGIVVADISGVSGGAAPIIVLVAIYSLTSPLNIAGVRTLIPRLVPEHGLSRAYAVDTSSYNLVEVLGPVAGGVLFGLIGGPATLTVIAGLYLVAGLTLLPLIVRTRSAPREEGEDRSLAREAAAGVAYVFRHPVLRGLAASYSLYQVAWGMLVVTVPVAVLGERSPDAQTSSVVGALWAVVGGGGIVGALLVGRVKLAGRERRFITTGTLLTALAIYPLIGHGGGPGMVIGLAVVGMVSGMVNVGLLTLRQRRTDPAWLGRVLAVSISVNLIGLPVGSALGGYLAARSTLWALATAGVVAAVGALLARVMIPDEEHGPVSAEKRADESVGKT